MEVSVTELDEVGESGSEQNKELSVRTLAIVVGEGGGMSNREHCQNIRAKWGIGLIQLNFHTSVFT